MKKVAALFVRSTSVYKRMPEVEAYDLERDALTYRGDLPCIAHPPCCTWSRLRHVAAASRMKRARAVAEEEHALALFAVETVRRVGGVIEHPAFSALWDEAELPLQGVDAFGGYTLLINQSWFGHRAEKPTWLYVCGVERCELPFFPFDLSVPQFALAQLSRSLREATPERFAWWLVEVAMRARRPRALDDHAAGAVTSAIGPRGQAGHVLEVAR